MARLKKAAKGGAGKTMAKSSLPTYKAVKVKTFRNTYYDLVPVADRPDHAAYPKVNLTRCPADNYYAVEPNLRKPMQMVTVLPDGLCLGWAYCGECKAWWGKCVCSNGISPPRSVEYIFDKHQAQAAGEEWNYLHDNYRGSLSRNARLKRQKALEGRGRGGRRIEPAQATTTASKRLIKRGSTTDTQPPRKTLKRASTTRTDSSSVITERGVDSKALDAAAKGQATDLNQQVLAHAKTTTDTNVRPRKLKKRSKA